MNAAAILYPTMASSSAPVVVAAPPAPAAAPSAAPNGADAAPAPAESAPAPVTGAPAAAAEADAPTPAPVAPGAVDERRNFFADVRAIEPAPSSPLDYAAMRRAPDDVYIGDGLPRALDAAAKSGIGMTAMSGFWNAYLDAERSPIQTTSDAARAALSQTYGAKVDAKLATAADFINDVAARWPGLKPMLNRTGLGNDPAFIRQVVACAEQRRR